MKFDLRVECSTADQLLSGFDAMKRAFEGKHEAKSNRPHVKDMSFAQELVMMPLFPRETAVPTPKTLSFLHKVSTFTNHDHVHIIFRRYRQLSKESIQNWFPRQMAGRPYRIRLSVCPFPLLAQLRFLGQCSSNRYMRTCPHKSCALST